MNWGREALDLYEKNLNKVGKIEYRGEFPYTLLPTFHSTATAQITVTIDEEGNFLHGEQRISNFVLGVIAASSCAGVILKSCSIPAETITFFPSANLTIST